MQKLKGKRGFIPHLEYPIIDTDKKDVYYKFYCHDNYKSNEFYLRNDVFGLVREDEVIIYSSRDKSYLLFKGDKHHLLKMGKLIKRDMLLRNIIDISLKHNLIKNYEYGVLHESKVDYDTHPYLKRFVLFR